MEYRQTTEIGTQMKAEEHSNIAGEAGSVSSVLMSTLSA